MVSRRRLTRFLVCAGLCVCVLAPTLSAQEKVKARLGVEIETDGQSRIAKGRDRLRTSDLFRFYVTPLQPAYVYFVYASPQEVSLINETEASQQVSPGTPVVYPSKDDGFSPDPSHRKEYYTIICSPKKESELLKLLGSKAISYEKWRQFEMELIERNKFNLSEFAEKPLDKAIAGNVRLLDPQALPIFTGKSLVIRRYEFNVSN